MRRGRQGRSNERMDWKRMQEKQWSEENVPKSEPVTNEGLSGTKRIQLSREFVIN